MTAEGPRQACALNLGGRASNILKDALQLSLRCAFGWNPEECPRADILCVFRGNERRCAIHSGCQKSALAVTFLSFFPKQMRNTVLHSGCQKSAPALTFYCCFPSTLATLRFVLDAMSAHALTFYRSLQANEAPGWLSETISMVNDAYVVHVSPSYPPALFVFKVAGYLPNGPGKAHGRPAEGLLVVSEAWEAFG